MDTSLILLPPGQRSCPICRYSFASHFSLISSSFSICEFSCIFLSSCSCPLSFKSRHKKYDNLFQPSPPFFVCLSVSLCPCLVSLKWQYYCLTGQFYQFYWNCFDRRPDWLRTSPVEGVEGLHRHNCETNLVVILHELCLLLWHFINTTDYHLAQSILLIGYADNVGSGDGWIDRGFPSLIIGLEVLPLR